MSIRVCHKHEYTSVDWHDGQLRMCPLCKAERDLKRRWEMIYELTKQPPDQDEEICKHGGLKRKCEICERDKEIWALKLKIDTLKQNIRRE